jgi:hypothetical protein
MTKKFVHHHPAVTLGVFTFAWRSYGFSTHQTAFLLKTGKRIGLVLKLPSSIRISECHCGFFHALGIWGSVDSVRQHEIVIDGVSALTITAVFGILYKIILLLRYI